MSCCYALSGPLKEDDTFTDVNVEEWKSEESGGEVKVKRGKCEREVPCFRNVMLGRGPPSFSLLRNLPFVVCKVGVP